MRPGRATMRSGAEILVAPPPHISVLKSEEVFYLDCKE
jgi:hypothetical protein